MIPLEQIDFKALIAKETNGRVRVRLMALSHIKKKVLIKRKQQETTKLAVVALTIGSKDFMRMVRYWH